MQHILFVDPCCPTHYDAGTFALQGSGASESYLYTLARALALQPGDVQVWIAQWNRQVDVLELDGRLRIIGKATLEQLPVRPDLVVVQRLPKTFVAMREQFRQAKMVLWTHDMPHQMVLPAQLLQDERSCIVAQSRFHAYEWQVALRRAGVPFHPSQVRHIYPFIAMDMAQPTDRAPEPTPDFNPNKLVYLMAALKGLDHVLKVFQKLRTALAQLELHVACPSYSVFQPLDALKQELKAQNIYVHERSLTRSQVLQELQTSMAALHVTPHFPETFGQINVESNMVGTPVLAGARGATPEVLFNPGVQTIEDTSNVQKIYERLLQWQQGSRPWVQRKPEFTLSAVLPQWLVLAL